MTLRSATPAVENKVNSMATEVVTAKASGRIAERPQLISAVGEQWRIHPNERSKIVAAKFELYKSSNGEYRWRLKATNGGSSDSAGGERSPSVCVVSLAVS